MLRATLRTALAHKGRLLLSALSVILGVAFVTGTLMLTNAMDRTFVEIIEGSAQDVQVTREPVIAADLFSEGGSTPPLRVSSKAVDEVREVDGVQAAAGAITVPGTYLISADGDAVGGDGPPALGGNWEPDPDLRVATITDGRPPADGDEIAVDDVSFSKLGVDIGNRVEVVTPKGNIETTLVGVFRFGETGGLAGATLTAFTAERAQELLTAADRWTAIDVAVADGFSDDEVASAIEEALDDPRLVAKTRATQVEEQSTELREGLAFFNYIMIGFAAIALFVAAFLIHNTFSILIAQRGQELALLRAIGATRAQVLRSVLVEALLLALLAAAVGVGLGFLLAHGLSAMFAAFGLDLTAGIAITPQAVLWATVVGVVVTVLAALLPAMRASRIPPVAALRDVASADEGVGRVRTALGLVVLLASGAVIAFGLNHDDTGQKAQWTAIGGVLLLVSLVVLSPLLAAVLIRWATPLLAVVGRTTGLLAARNAARAPKRVAATASALTIGVGLIVGVTVITASAKASIEQLVDDSFRAGYVVGAATQQPFTSSVADDIRELPQVEYVFSEIGGPVLIDGQDGSVTAVGGGPLDRLYAVDEHSGEFGELTSGSAIASQELALDSGWELGSTVSVTYPSGEEQDLTIDGIYRSNELISGLIVSLEDFRSAVGADQDNLLSVIAEDDADPDATKEAIEAVAASNPLLRVLDQAGIKEEVSSQLNQLLFFIYAMLALSVIIAALGVLNTLALSVIERTREIGLFRAVGATRRQVRQTIRWEAIVVSLLGALLGILAGTGIGVALQRALADEGIGVLAIPTGTLLIILVLAVVIGVLAAALPARRAAKLNILTAIASE